MLESNLLLQLNHMVLASIASILISLLLLILVLTYFLPSTSSSTSSLSNLPGPQTSSWLLGNILDQREHEIQPGQSQMRILREAASQTVKVPIPLGLVHEDMSLERKGIRWMIR